MKTAVSEKLITNIWQRQMITNLVTDSGKELQIIYPGRPSNGNGCDFKDAVFALDKKIETGDIEIHVKSSQWYSHGHNRDPKYNNIVLHVAMWHDSQSPTILQNGRTIPTIYLSCSLSESWEKLLQQISLPHYVSSSCPQANNFSNAEYLGNLLTAAGEERFTTKVALFWEALEKGDAEQVLLRGLARALGYAQNTRPSEELANRLPLSFLEKVRPDTDAVKQALILGTAGLLPSQRHKMQHNTIEDEEAQKLETIWRSNGISETMKESDWCFSRVRPDNFPTRRLVALSHMLARYSKQGLLHGILQLVKEAPTRAKSVGLENGFTIHSQGYWANHIDFGIAKKRTSALLGWEKATEIVINIILPFIYAWSEIAAEPNLRDKAIIIYRHYPKLGDNELTRYMKQQLLIEPGVNLTACQQQGLIHIFKSNCRQRNCATCPVGLNRN
jgi:hypothetical protein